MLQASSYLVMGNLADSMPINRNDHSSININNLKKGLRAYTGYRLQVLERRESEDLLSSHRLVKSYLDTWIHVTTESQEKVYLQIITLQ